MKNYKEILTITIPSNKMNSLPPIGPIIGQRGLNIMELSKQYNNLTLKYIDDIPINSNIYIFKNKTFKFKIKKPSYHIQLKYLLGLNKLTNNTIITIYELYELINYNYNLLYKHKNILYKNIILKQMLKNVINTLKTFNIQIKQ